MVRYPLYQGGFILLPQQVISGLYVLEKCKDLSIEEQIQLLNVGVKFETKSTELNKIRNSFMKLNDIEVPENIGDIINTLNECSLIKVKDNSYKIDYLHSIEFTNYNLDKVMIYLLTDLRKMMSTSEEMVSYLKSLDLSNLKLADTSQSYVLMANGLMANTKEPSELLKRTSFVKELTEIKKNICEVAGVEKNN